LNIETLLYCIHDHEPKKCVKICGECERDNITFNI